jgi:hypothetical protein
MTDPTLPLTGNQASGFPLIAMKTPEVVAEYMAQVFRVPAFLATARRTQQEGFTATAPVDRESSDKALQRDISRET